MPTPLSTWFKTSVLSCISLMASLWLTACQDDLLTTGATVLPAEEGIPGSLTLTLIPDAAINQTVAARNSASETSDQHVHAVYVFVINRPQGATPDQCPILSRQYFPDAVENLVEINEPGLDKSVHVTQLTLHAVSAQRAQIFALVNLGYSQVQGIGNDPQLLQACDQAKSLADLQALQARLSLSDKQEVNVERMQGHHLMSGFFRPADRRHFLQDEPFVTLKPEADGTLSLQAADGSTAYRPLGATSQQPGSEGKAASASPGTLTAASQPAALFVHRLDTKITFRIEPDGALKHTPGAYFRLVSWQVLNAPLTEALYFDRTAARKPVSAPSLAHSKVFRRDLLQGDDNSWEFTYYQFENTAQPTEGQLITPEVVAREYNREYNRKAGSGSIPPCTPQEVVATFEQYPNPYSLFAYSLRELQEKKLTTGGMYEPNLPDNCDSIVQVVNGDYRFAPQNATYVRLVGRYYNPAEPLKRRKDDPVSIQLEGLFPLDSYPYWGPGNVPVKTEQEAKKRMRSANVIYYVHLGYVGGSNYRMDHDPSNGPAASQSADTRWATFQEKVNDYKVLRNHHYHYTLKVAGVENIKLEATRENGGNILEQEKQPGAEGEILESQHFYNLDSHYETRNLTIDFKRMPENYLQAFSFAIDTPFDRVRGTLRKTAEGKLQLFDKQGNPVNNIHEHDWDWIHFVWHGTPDHPARSLIDSKTGNGIPYSETYGGYELQRTYDETFLTQTQDEAHPYRLLNSLEFLQLVWDQFMRWKNSTDPHAPSTLTFTVYIDEYYYDFNPLTHAQVNWWEFCNKPKRRALYFMEPEEISADQHSWYADAHVALYQQSIQTLYATGTQNGQVVADVAFGLEGLDEFRAQYNCTSSHPTDGLKNDHGFEYDSHDNGLYNTMRWYQQNKNHPEQIIDWKIAAQYFTENCRAKEPDQADYTNQYDTENRSKRRGQWALYSRNRDLNRNGRLDPEEIRWFVPAIDQYTLCFLGGRPVFENPLFEKDKAVKVVPGMGADSWIEGVPVLHYLSSTNVLDNRIFWAEEGCSKGNYNDGKVNKLYGIRMGRMLCRHGVNDTGLAFGDQPNPQRLMQDALFTVTHTPNGQPVPYPDRTNGKSYYIRIDKLNANAFRDRVETGELAHHTHEKKQNWLYRSYRIGKNKVGYTAYTSATDYNRAIRIDGIARTWWQVNGVWSPEKVSHEDYYYRGEEYSLAYKYAENTDGSDVHHWRMPNLREAAILSMAFPSPWFGGKDALITSCTESDNLGPQSTQTPFWRIGSGSIMRMNSQEVCKFYVRPIRDY